MARLCGLRARAAQFRRRRRRRRARPAAHPSHVLRAHPRGERRGAAAALGARDDHAAGAARRRGLARALPRRRLRRRDAAPRARRSEALVEPDGLRALPTGAARARRRGVRAPPMGGLRRDARRWRIHRLRRLRARGLRDARRPRGRPVRGPRGPRALRRRRRRGRRLPALLQARRRQVFPGAAARVATSAGKEIRRRPNESRERRDPKARARARSSSPRRPTRSRRAARLRPPRASRPRRATSMFGSARTATASGAFPRRRCRRCCGGSS